MRNGKAHFHFSQEVKLQKLSARAYAEHQSTVDGNGNQTTTLTDCAFANDVTVNGTVLWGCAPQIFHLASELIENAQA
jgi:hypothetical protein